VAVFSYERVIESLTLMIRSKLQILQFSCGYC